MLKIFRRVLSLIMLVISVSLIVWASLPNQHQAITQSISRTEMQLPSSGQVLILSMMEDRQVVLEWPNSMRIGEMEEITLSFELVHTDTLSSNFATEFSDVYDSYNIMAEARFEVAGIKVSPVNPTRESMPLGQSVKFKWQVSTDQAGSYDGTLWLSLRFLPLDGSQASQIPIYIHEVGIHSSSLYGLNEMMAFILGGVGVMLAAVIIFDDMIGWVKRLMKKKTTKVRK
jgi:hypothetical protein